MTHETPVNILVQLGLSEYEAKAYVALLRLGRASAYAIAYAAAIPTSKVYQAMQKLVRRQIVVKVVNTHGKTGHYRAMPAQRFLDGLAVHHARLLTNAVRALKPIKGAPTDELIWSLEGWDDIRNRALRMVSEAKRHVLISGWPQELTQFDAALQMAYKRKCRMAMIHYGESSADRPFPVFIHRQIEQVCREHAGCFFCLATDGEQVLFAHIPEQAPAMGAYSTHAAFVGVTEDFLRHDIYFLKVMRRFEALLMATFGNDLALLRDPFTDAERPAAKVK